MLRSRVGSGLLLLMLALILSRAKLAAQSTTLVRVDSVAVSRTPPLALVMKGPNSNDVFKTLAHGMLSKNTPPQVEPFPQLEGTIVIDTAVVRAFVDAHRSTRLTATAATNGLFQLHVENNTSNEFAIGLAALEPYYRTRAKVAFDSIFQIGRIGSCRILSYPFQKLPDDARRKIARRVLRVDSFDVRKLNVQSADSVAEAFIPFIWRLVDEGAPNSGCQPSNATDLVLYEVSGIPLVRVSVAIGSMPLPLLLTAKFRDLGAGNPVDLKVNADVTASTDLCTVAGGEAGCRFEGTIRPLLVSFQRGSPDSSQACTYESFSSATFDGCDSRWAATKGEVGVGFVGTIALHEAVKSRLDAGGAVQWTLDEGSARNGILELGTDSHPVGQIEFITPSPQISNALLWGVGVLFVVVFGYVVYRWKFRVGEPEADGPESFLDSWNPGTASHPSDSRGTANTLDAVRAKQKAHGAAKSGARSVESRSALTDGDVFSRQIDELFSSSLANYTESLRAAHRAAVLKLDASIADSKDKAIDALGKVRDETKGAIDAATRNATESTEAVRKARLDFEQFASALSHELAKRAAAAGVSEMQRIKKYAESLVPVRIADLSNGLARTPANLTDPSDQHADDLSEMPFRQLFDKIRSADDATQDSLRRIILIVERFGQYCGALYSVCAESESANGSLPETLSTMLSRLTGFAQSDGRLFRALRAFAASECLLEAGKTRDSDYASMLEMSAASWWDSDKYGTVARIRISGHDVATLKAFPWFGAENLLQGLQSYFLPSQSDGRIDGVMQAVQYINEACTYEQPAGFSMEKIATVQREKKGWPGLLDYNPHEMIGELATSLGLSYTPIRLYHEMSREEAKIVGESRNWESYRQIVKADLPQPSSTVPIRVERLFLQQKRNLTFFAGRAIFARPENPS